MEESKLEYKKAILEKFKTRNGNDEWNTYNDRLNTIIFDKEGLEISRKDIIKLSNNEYPLLECDLPNGNYFLMTTDYIYSYFRRYLLKKDYQSLTRINDCTYFFRDAKPRNKTELYVIECKNQELLFFEIDSDYPGYYAMEFLRVILKRNL